MRPASFSIYMNHVPHSHRNSTINLPKNDIQESRVALQTEVSALSPRVAFLDHQRSVLTMGNSALKQRIAALAQDKIFKDGEFLPSSFSLSIIYRCRPRIIASSPSI